MNATHNAERAEQFDKLLTIVDRNIHTFARMGGEVNRHRVLAAQAEAIRVIDTLGQSGLDRAGYAWRSTSAATLNSALDQRASQWRKQRSHAKGFNNPVMNPVMNPAAAAVLVIGGAK